MRKRATASEATLPPIFLLQADFRGTLAALRCLGARGVTSVVAGTSLLAPARWSRFATRVVASPPAWEPEKLLAWLLEAGHRDPGQVLYPTSDDLAWLFSLHREALGRVFRLYSPPIETLERLLDKRQMHALAIDANLAAPPTEYPDSAREAVVAARKVGYPVLLKPRTQVFSLTHSKGMRVDREADLAAAFDATVASLRYAPSLLARLPGAGLPMLQRYQAARSDAVYTVSGFASRSAIAARASSKILQRPRGLGVGLCFEGAPLAPGLDDAIGRFFRAAGYYGAFDVEFLDVDGRRLLIDVNPRFYNQMAFEVDRGIPTPWLAYRGALGDEAAIDAILASARAQAPAGDAVYCDRFAAAHDLAWQLAFGTVSLAEQRRWRTWYTAHRAHLTDPMAVPGDRAPQLAEVASELAGAIRHPRSFLRKTALGRSS